MTYCDYCNKLFMEDDEINKTEYGLFHREECFDEFAYEQLYKDTLVYKTSYTQCQTCKKETESMFSMVLRTLICVDCDYEKKQEEWKPVPATGRKGIRIR